VWEGKEKSKAMKREREMRGKNHKEAMRHKTKSKS
jgi:hypothetical protein